MKLNLSLSDKLLKQIQDFRKTHPEWTSDQDAIRDLIVKGLQKHKETKT